ncbi:MAG: type II secretion system GspH family protein [Acidobacteriota bacterium]|nr:type II secretion system GspH family protein [Acidobacteriota bacterium]
MRAERGFTLIELMAALLILTFVITSTLWAFLQRNKMLQQASEITLAYQALANEAEYLRRVNFDALASGSDFQSDTTLLAPLVDSGTAVTVEVVKPGVKSVTMTIRWKNGEREARLGLIRVHTGAAEGASLF